MTPGEGPRPRADTVTIAVPASKKRIVVLGDPHGDVIALGEVLEREKRDDTAIFSAGDNIGYADGPSCSFLVELLASEKIPSVFGNHEAWSLSGKLFLSVPGLPDRLTPEALAWCRALPYRIRIAAERAPDLELDLVHTLPNWAYVNEDKAEAFLEHEGARIVFSGHTHSPAIYSVRDGRCSVKRLHPKGDVPLRVAIEPGVRYVVDAGSLARPGSAGKRPRLFAQRGTYAALDLEERVIRVYSFDKRKKLEELLRREVEENTRQAREAARKREAPRPEEDRGVS